MMTITRSENFRRSGACALLLLMLLTLGGCATLFKTVFEKPKLNLIDVQVTQVGLVQQRYRLTLEIENPNAVPFPVDSIRYHVRLAGMDFADGETTEGFDVPAHGKTNFQVDVTTNLFKLAGQFANLLSSNTSNLDYEVVGDVKVGGLFGGTIPIHQVGTMSYRRPG